MIYQQHMRFFKIDSFVGRYIVVNYKVVGIFIDVPKTFDCVNPEFLLKKTKIFTHSWSCLLLIKIFL